MLNKFKEVCLQKNLSFTGPREIIAEILLYSNDHPDIDEICMRAKKIDKSISIATTYRTINLFVELGLVKKFDFGGGRNRYEDSTKDHEHYHIIDIEGGNVIEFENPDIRQIMEKICLEHKIDMIDYKFEIYGKKKA